MARGARIALLVFCGLVFLASLSSAAWTQPPKAADQTSSPDGTTVLTADANSAHSSGETCTDATSPASARRLSRWTAPFLGRNVVAQGPAIVIDMSEPACLPLPVSLAVPNQTKLKLQLKVPAKDAACSAVESAAPVSGPDIGAILQKFLGGLPTTFGLGIFHKQGPAEVDLPPLTNAKATISVSCAYKGKPDNPVPKKTVTITYQNLSPVNASAGAIVSLLGSKTYGVVTSETGVSNGSVNSQYAIGVTSSSDIQLVPVAFLNTYLFGNTRTHIDLQAGLARRLLLSRPPCRSGAIPEEGLQHRAAGELAGLQRSCRLRHDP